MNATPNRHTRSLLGTLMILLLTSGCASAGGSSESAGPSFPQVAGEWTGSISVQGEAVPGTFLITQTGADLEGTFRAPALELVASGSGAVLPNGSLSMSLSYNLQCPGTATMTGALSTDGTQISGRLLASDCTGNLDGSFRFSR